MRRRWRRRRRAGESATDADGREFSNVPAPGVAPLVLKSHEALMMATERRKPKPKIVYDDERRGNGADEK